MAQGIVAGIDWASDVHVACLLDADGAVTDRVQLYCERFVRPR
jgi:hypothetical protein